MHELTRACFESVMGSFVSIIFLGMTLEREWYKFLPLHNCSIARVYVLVKVYLYIFLCVCECVSKNGAFMKLTFILILYIVECSLNGEYLGVYVNSFKSQLLIYNRKAV